MNQSTHTEPVSTACAACRVEGCTLKSCAETFHAERPFSGAAFVGWSALFFLLPLGTALAAALMFNETLATQGLAGISGLFLGMFLTNRLVPRERTSTPSSPSTQSFS
jgi:hypothetical protein